MLGILAAHDSEDSDNSSDSCFVPKFLAPDRYPLRVAQSKPAFKRIRNIVDIVDFNMQFAVLIFFRILQNDSIRLVFVSFSNQSRNHVAAT